MGLLGLAGWLLGVHWVHCGGYLRLFGKRQPRAILTNSGRLGCVARVAGEFGSDGPGEKLVDLIDRVLGDAGQHVSQIAFWFDTVQLGGSDQAVHGCGAFPATIGACEQEVLSA